MGTEAAKVLTIWVWRDSVGIACDFASGIWLRICFGGNAVRTTECAEVEEFPVSPESCVNHLIARCRGTTCDPTFVIDPDGLAEGSS